MQNIILIFEYRLGYWNWQTLVCINCVQNISELSPPRISFGQGWYGKIPYKIGQTDLLFKFGGLSEILVIILFFCLFVTKWKTQPSQLPGGTNLFDPQKALYHTLITKNGNYGWIG